MHRQEELSEQSIPSSFAASRYISFVEKPFLAAAITFSLCGCVCVGEKEWRKEKYYALIINYQPTRIHDGAFISCFFAIFSWAFVVVAAIKNVYQEFNKVEWGERVSECSTT